ncbi:hypothetical protein N8482_02980, partial [Chitinophagales bacterium]|nr:hypothetical protein [Chitinophagales bacterium]
SRKIENGVYSISSNSESFIYERKNFSFNPDMDFEIEAELKITEGQLLAGGLIWGGTSNALPDEWTMVMDLDRNVSIGNFGLQEYIRSPNFDTELNEFNRYTIRKIADKYYFYINGEAHNVIDYSTFEEKRYGFIVTPGSAIEIESFRVSFLNN